jgi:alanine dehydrogenase
MDALVTSGARFFAFEFIEDDEGRFPTGAPGGEIAGVQAVFQAAGALQSPRGRGVLLARVAGACPAHVVIIGSGHAGSAAARTAAALGARVTVLTTQRSLDTYRQSAPAGVAVWPNTPETLRNLLPSADVLIGTLLISTVDTPAMVTEHELDLMPAGAVLVDVTCGYGSGYLPTAGPVQAPGDPPRLVRGIQHIKLDALPELVPRTASAAYARHMSPYLIRLARHTLHRVGDAGIQRALVAARGRLIHPVCRTHAAHWRAAAEQSEAGERVPS